MLAIDDFGRPSRRASSLGPGRDAAVLGEQIEDRRRAGDRRCEGVGLRAAPSPVRDRCSCVAHRRCSLHRAPRCPASLLNRVPYLDSHTRAAHTVQPTAVCSVCWTMARVTEEDPPVGRGIRLVATAIIPILVVTACNTAASPSPSASSRASVPAASGPGGERIGGRRRTEVHGRHRQPADVQRPAGRGAAPAARAGLRGSSPARTSTSSRSPSRTSTTRRSSTRRPGRTASTRYVFDPQWMGDFVGPGYLEDLTDRVDGRHRARLARHRAVLPRLQRDLRRQDLHDPARRRLPHGLLPVPTCSKTARRNDLGRLPDDRRSSTTARTSTATASRTTARASPRRRAQQSYWWIISIAARPAPDQGHRARARSSTPRT